MGYSAYFCYVRDQRAPDLRPFIWSQAEINQQNNKDQAGNIFLAREKKQNDLRPIHICII